MKTLTTETFYEGLVFGEGIRWHDGKIWVSDMFGHRVYRIDAQGRAETFVEVPYRPSGIGFCPDGGVLVVSMQNRSVLKISGAKVSEFADLKGFATGDLNDLVVAGNGNTYTGNFGFDLFGGTDAPRLTCLVLITPDGACRKVADELNFPNGIAVTPDCKKLIVAETFDHKLTAFDIQPDGGLTNRRLFAQLGERIPDGICLDAEGAVWAASFGTGEVIRVLEGGEITHIAKPGPKAVTCTLGGADRKTLYMVAADTEIDRLAKGDSRSWIVRTQVEVPGVGWP